MIIIISSRVPEETAAFVGFKLRALLNGKGIS